MLLFLLFFVLTLPLLIWLFIRSKTKKTKWIVGVVAILFTTFLTFMALGLWSLDVEDFYGDKQDIFWEGSSGDIIKLIDDKTKKVLAMGTLKKTWHRINVESNGDETTLRQWIGNEAGDAFVETMHEIEDGVITVIVLDKTK
ncbi:MAG: hypothetical protein EOO47_20805 [Flavobacterium sp.]|nr:MAG: hypothetical protein EOO47_20805 [Flavobacterium sp.]